MMSLRGSIILWLLSAGHLMAQAPEEDIRGPKPQVEIPQPEKFPVAIWAWIGGGILLAILAYFLWRRLARRKRGRSPLAIAFASLAELEKNRNALAADAFANQAAGTIREYIAARFGIAAPRRTTEEFFRDLTDCGAQPVIAESDHLKAFLKACDLAKFAGSDLDARQRDELIHAARGFVTATSTPDNPKAAKS